MIVALLLLLLLLLQVDVTAQGTTGDSKAPAWTKTASDEAIRVKQGNQAASLISSALQNMGWGASPWAQISGNIMRAKPHKAADKAYQMLLQRQQHEGPLRLSNFRRVKQLGAGDVGLVDLVQLQVRLQDISQPAQGSLGAEGGWAAPAVATGWVLLISGLMWEVGRG
jgi:hypothetical protein